MAVLPVAEPFSALCAAYKLRGSPERQAGGLRAPPESNGCAGAVPCRKMEMRRKGLKCSGQLSLTDLFVPISAALSLFITKS